MKLKRPISYLSPKTGFGAVINSLFTNVLILLLGVGTGVLTARVLGPTGRGELAATIMWPQFLAYMFDFGLPAAFIYALKRTPARESTLMGTTLLLGLGASVVSVAVGIIGIPFWLHRYSPRLINEAQWLMFLAPLGLISLLFLGALQARSEFGYFNRLRFFQPILTLLVLLVLFLTHRLTPFAAALSYMISGIPIFLLELEWVRKFIKPKFDGFFAEMRDLVSYGLRAWGANFMGMMRGNIDQLLIVVLLSPADMGLYIVAQGFARVIQIIPSAIVPVLMPKVTGLARDEAVAIGGRTVRIASLIMICCAIPIFLFSPTLLQLIYGVHFVSATHVFQLLLGAGILSGMVELFAQLFMALGRPGLMTSLEGGGLAVTFILLIILVPYFGLVGAGIALLASSLLRLLAILISFPVVLKISAPSLRPNIDDLSTVWKRFV